MSSFVPEPSSSRRSTISSQTTDRLDDSITRKKGTRRRITARETKNIFRENSDRGGVFVEEMSSNTLTNRRGSEHHVLANTNNRKDSNQSNTTRNSVQKEFIEFMIKLGDEFIQFAEEEEEVDLLVNEEGGRTESEEEKMFVQFMMQLAARLTGREEQQIEKSSTWQSFTWSAFRLTIITYLFTMSGVLLFTLLYVFSAQQLLNDAREDWRPFGSSGFGRNKPYVSMREVMYGWHSGYKDDENFPRIDVSFYIGLLIAFFLYTNCLCYSFPILGFISIITKESHDNTSAYCRGHSQNNSSWSNNSLEDISCSDNDEKKAEEMMNFAEDSSSSRVSNRSKIFMLQRKRSELLHENNKRWSYQEQVQKILLYFYFPNIILFGFLFRLTQFLSAQVLKWPVYWQQVNLVTFVCPYVCGIWWYMREKLYYDGGFLFIMLPSLTFGFAGLLIADIFPLLWVITTSETGRVIMRVLIFPTIFELAQVPMHGLATVVHHYPRINPYGITMLAIPILCGGNFYFRFLNAQVSSVYLMVVIEVFGCLYVRLLRVTSGRRLKYYSMLMNKIQEWTKLDEKNKVFFQVDRSQVAEKVLAAISAQEVVNTYVSIFTSATFILLMNLSVSTEDTGLSFQTILLNVMIQLFFELVADIIFCWFAVTKMKIPLWEGWARRPMNYNLFFLIYAVGTVCFIVQNLVGLLCHIQVPDYPIVSYYCTEGSNFDSRHFGI